jgi:hypothetical protein
MNGLEAVCTQIISQFHITEQDIQQHLDFDTKDTTLRFPSGEREHDVRLTNEFSDDYAASKPKMNLSRLKELLGTHGAVFTSSRGIAADNRSVSAARV